MSDLRELTNAELDDVGGGQLNLPVGIIGEGRALATIFLSSALVSIEATVRQIQAIAPLSRGKEIPPRLDP